MLETVTCQAVAANAQTPFDLLLAIVLVLLFIHKNLWVKVIPNMKHIEAGTTHWRFVNIIESHKTILTSFSSDWKK